MELRQAAFKAREDRTRYLFERYGAYLQGCVLDVGCDRAVLKQLAPSIEYLGIDVGGTPDLQLDLEAVVALPFQDKQFDCVVCSDVLEHLDNLHLMFAELVRVTRGHLVLSLPNCWNVARRPIARGRGHFLHYGLPLDPPQDRHKWFFSISEAVDFLRGQGRRHSIHLKDLHTTEKPRSALIRSLRRALYPNPLHYCNRYAHTLWALIRV